MNACVSHIHTHFGSGFFFYYYFHRDCLPLFILRVLVFAMEFHFHAKR